MTRDEVLVFVPPNSNTVIDGRLLTVTRPEEHSDWSDFLCLGALSLVSALEQEPGLKPVYLDGTVVPLDDVLAYISDNAGRLLAVCLGVLTANYEAGLLIARHAKDADPRITTVVGNDHFTAMPRLCMESAPALDYGFVGNEVVNGFTRLISALRAGAPIDPAAHPGLVHRGGGAVHITPPGREPVFADYDYGLVDRAFSQTPLYAKHFERRIAPRMRQLTGRRVTAGVPVEIGRGCVKFAGDDACSFCSIQPGHLWRNQLSPHQAWSAMEGAWRNGYDYLYLTADELPLTFATLLSGMSRSAPHWWSALPEDERPVLVGYGRADGIADARRTALLTSLGIRQIMIGMDAGAPLSLAAMNKPVGGRRREVVAEAERLYALNWDAVTVARNHGLLIRAGFVIGHIGMTRELLDENVQRILALITEGAKGGVFSAVDVEVLSPQPGARDFTYLTSPSAAKDGAARLGLSVASDATLEEIAGAWRRQDIVAPEDAMRDYTRALMPDLAFDDLAGARSAIRAHAKGLGVVIGE
ncbi:B12-binding domain-containing radical SAM protein [Streptomyces sp. NPDC001480]|uniref:B12-binding domain-containing radical SAM protein n=1 Tax=Streptomyces sp. NPDC001480 TaxID=3364577 RepID=UPI0036A17114